MGHSRSNSRRPGDTLSGLVIGQVCHSNFGGSSKAACRLANALAVRGHASHVFSLEPAVWQLHANVIQHSVRPMSILTGSPFYRNWAQKDRDALCDLLCGFLSAQHLDILHYHYAHPFADVLGQVARTMGADMPVCIGTLHGTDLTEGCVDQDALKLLMDSFINTDELTTVSSYMSALLQGLVPGAAPLRVLPNFVEDDWPQCDSDGRPDKPPDTRVILHVSNFRPVKNTGLLARLFIEIHKQTGAELWLVGDGPDMPELRRTLDKSTAGSAVRYWGATAHPEGFFCQADLFLSTSRQESFGLAALEAMASGVPVASSAVGGIPELVLDNETGIVFDPADADTAVDRIVSLLGSPQKLQDMREKSIGRARMFRQSGLIGEYEAMYWSHVKSRSPQSAG